MTRTIHKISRTRGSGDRFIFARLVFPGEISKSIATARSSSLIRALITADAFPALTSGFSLATRCEVNVAK